MRKEDLDSVESVESIDRRREQIGLLPGDALIRLSK